MSISDCMRNKESLRCAPTLLCTVLYQYRALSSNRLLQVRDVLCPVKVEVDKVSLAEVIVAVLEEVVLHEAALEAHALLSLKLKVIHEWKLEAFLAEADRLAETLGNLALGLKGLQVLLGSDPLNHCVSFKC